MKKTLYVATPCPFCTKVLAYLDTNKQSDLTIIDTEWDIEQHDSLREKYGKSQVPLLLIENDPIYESEAIIEHFEKEAS